MLQKDMHVVLTISHDTTVDLGGVDDFATHELARVALTLLRVIARKSGRSVEDAARVVVEGDLLQRRLNAERN